jgi:hypothetical protein
MLPLGCIGLGRASGQVVPVANASTTSRGCGRHIR